MFTSKEVLGQIECVLEELEKYQGEEIPSTPGGAEGEHPLHWAVHCLEKMLKASQTAHAVLPSLLCQRWFHLLDLSREGRKLEAAVAAVLLMDSLRVFALGFAWRDMAIQTGLPLLTRHENLLEEQWPKACQKARRRGGFDRLGTFLGEGAQALRLLNRLVDVDWCVGHELTPEQHTELDDVRSEAYRLLRKDEER